MSNYKLVYFTVRGRGEVIRLLLKDNNIDFEEENCRDGWFEKYKPNMPFGQVPILYDGDYMLAQSCAILRYLARKHDLYGCETKEQGRIDMICDGAEDLRAKYQTMIYKNYDAGKESYIDSLPGELKHFEELLKRNNGGETYMVGDTISFLDYVMFELLDIHLVLLPSCLNECPLLHAYYNRIAERPNIVTHRSTEEYKNMYINGNRKQ